jgi:hypothetical protein
MKAIQFEITCFENISSALAGMALAGVSCRLGNEGSWLLESQVPTDTMSWQAAD